MSIYDFTVKTIQGKEKSLADYKGKVLLIIDKVAAGYLAAASDGFDANGAGREYGIFGTCHFLLHLGSRKILLDLNLAEGIKRLTMFVGIANHHGNASDRWIGIKVTHIFGGHVVEVGTTERDEPMTFLFIYMMVCEEWFAKEGVTHSKTKASVWLA